jgi:hypothetical protein
LSAVLKKVDARIWTLIRLEVYHIVRLLQVALMSASLHLTLITGNVLRMSHLVVGLARFTSVIGTRHVIARVRRLTLEHVVRLVEARLRNITTLMRGRIVLRLHMLPAENSLLRDDWLRAIHGLICLLSSCRVVLHLLLLRLLPRVLIAIVLRVNVVVNVVRVHDLALL